MRRGSFQSLLVPVHKTSQDVARRQQQSNADRDHGIHLHGFVAGHHVRRGAFSHGPENGAIHEDHVNRSERCECQVFQRHQPA